MELVDGLDITTYFIYHDGKIEKYVSASPSEANKNKYKYVYVDKNNTKHEICIVDLLKVDKRADKGTTVYSIPKDYVDKNGGVYATGTIYGKKYYAKGIGKIELVKMKDSLKYNKSGVKIYYEFKNSQRRYCNPNAYAAFLGALAEMGRIDVLCTGMCFADGTSYPSVSHPNGDSVDTAYLSTLKDEQIKVDAFKKFNFKHILRGQGWKMREKKKVTTISWLGKLKNSSYHSGHEDHLHAGDFDLTKVKVIK